MKIHAVVAHETGGPEVLQWEQMDLAPPGAGEVRVRHSAIGSEEKAKLGRENGCEHVILYRTDDVPARVKEITGGKGVPVVYDSVGKDTWTMSLDCLCIRGLMVTFGNASGPVGAIDPRI